MQSISRWWSERHPRAFWSWWAANRDSLARAIADGSLSSWVEPIAERVRRIDPRLDWEFGKGQRAAHYFCLSSKGDSAVRAVAERWKALGPGDDATFEFHAARPGGAKPSDVRLEIDGIAFGGSEFRVVVVPDRQNQIVNVRLWHPQFPEVSEEVRGNAAFLTLDALLGEDGVERWLGGIDVLGSAPDEDTDDLDGLLRVVADLRASAVGAHWVILKGATPQGLPVFVSLLRAIKRVDHPGLDTHFEIAITLADPSVHGLPTDAEKAATDAAIEPLEARLGGRGVLLAREFRNGLRVFHFHVSTTGDERSIVAAWARTQPWQVAVTSRVDPTWSISRRFG